MLCTDFFVPKPNTIHKEIGRVMRKFEMKKEVLIKKALLILDEATTIDKNISLWHLREEDQMFINTLIQLNYP